MRRLLGPAIQFMFLVTLLASTFAAAQDFREPKIPEVPIGPLTVNGAMQQSISPGSASSNQDAFFPRSNGDSLGLIPVRPRNGQGPGMAVPEPEYRGGRSQRDQRLLNQIREGNFDDAIPGLDPVERGPMTIRQRFPDGKTQLVRQVIQDEDGNYLNNGPWRLFNQRGEVVARGQFVNGLMDGTWERWHPGGTDGMFAQEPFTRFEPPFVSTATFAQGKLEGVWVISDRNSRKILEVPYRKGKRHGPATWFYPNSERLRTVSFRNGLLDGPIMEWDEQNRVTRNDEYIKGQKVVRVTSFFAPKQRRSETYYLEGKLVLEGEDSWWDGEPAEYVLDGVRVQHGPTISWHANGQRQMAGQYRDDERVGLFVWWHENGTKALAGRYTAGLKTGTWTWWHANGMKSIEGGYSDDEPVGQWIWWNESGEVTDRDDFGNGRDSMGNLPEPGNESGNESENDDSDNRNEGALPAEREEILPDDNDVESDAIQGVERDSNESGSRGEAGVTDSVPTGESEPQANERDDGSGPGL